jgi:Predicted periplasmic protein
VQNAYSADPLMKWQPIAEWLEAQNYQPRDLSDDQFSKLITKVNQSINQYPFIKDKGDTWKTPDQFKQDGGGDCEDYSIAKMDKLAKAGIPLKDMQIVIIRQNNIFSHAILAVRRGQQTYYLDNHYPNHYVDLEDGYTIALEIGLN